LCDAQYTIPIGELTGVLQTDLLLPLTKNDQIVSWQPWGFPLALLHLIPLTRCMYGQMVLNSYGTSDNEVDVRAMLTDAGKNHVNHCECHCSPHYLLG
jgi:hypothetical protein